jgi:NitT/TauT family transport system ATP-binding protein
MPHIEIRDVVKRFETAGGDIHAFGPATLAVDQGEFVSLVGPSGCGKSTLLLMIAGLLPPSEGEIRVDDRKVAGTRTDVGIMFQDNTLVAWRSVRRNV